MCAVLPLTANWAEVATEVTVAGVFALPAIMLTKNFSTSTSACAFCGEAVTASAERVMPAVPNCTPPLACWTDWSRGLCATPAEIAALLGAHEIGERRGGGEPRAVGRADGDRGLRQRPVKVAPAILRSIALFTDATSPMAAVAPSRNVRAKFSPRLGRPAGRSGEAAIVRNDAALLRSPRR